MSHVKPEDVHSPRGRWKLIDVLVDGGEAAWAVAIGSFDNKRMLAIRWSGTEDTPAGTPQARGNPTWLMVDPKFEDAILGADAMPPAKAQLARTLLGKPAG